MDGLPVMHANCRNRARNKIDLLNFVASFIVSLQVFGAMMRPLTFDDKQCNREKPLLQRMADEKRLQMERGSIGGSYFMVQLPDGSMEKRVKIPINVDPGVHSSFNLDQLVCIQ